MDEVGGERRWAADQSGGRPCEKVSWGERWGRKRKGEIKGDNERRAVNGYTAPFIFFINSKLKEPQISLTGL